MSSFIHSIWTVIVFVVFIGIVWWAYSSSKKKDFDEAANLIFDPESKKKPSSKEPE